MHACGWHSACLPLPASLFSGNHQHAKCRGAEHAHNTVPARAPPNQAAGRRVGPVLWWQGVNHVCAITDTPALAAATCPAGPPRPASLADPAAAPARHADTGINIFENPGKFLLRSELTLGRTAMLSECDAGTHPRVGRYVTFCVYLCGREGQAVSIMGSGGNGTVSGGHSRALAA